MKTILLLATLISTQTFAQTVAQSTTPRNGEVKDYKVIKGKHNKTLAEKDVKTNGKISTSGCELASGKTVTVGEQGYEECLRQIGTKKEDTAEHPVK